MSDPGTSDWNQNDEGTVSAANKSMSQSRMMLSVFPWHVKCLMPRDTSAQVDSFKGDLDASLVTSPRHCPLTPTTPSYFQANSYLATSATLPQPESPSSSMDDYPEFVATTPGSADEDTVQAEIAAESSCSYGKRKQTERTTAAHIRKSFTIDAILGLEDLATSLKSKGNNNARLSNSNNQESPSGRASYHFNQDQGAANGVTSAPSSSSSSRSKRVRTIFSAEQLEKLEAEFARQQYMVGPERLVLAASLRLSESQVKVWFQNRRIKWRKQHLESRQHMRFSNWPPDEHLVHHHRTFSQMFPAEGFDDALESLSD